jgi:hypothetical protein
VASARAGNVEESALCLIAALRLDTTTPQGAAGARILAHFIEDTRLLRSVHFEER